MHPAADAAESRHAHAPDVIDTIVAVFGAVATTVSGMYVLLRRMERRIDLKFERVDQLFEKVEQRFEKVDEEFRLVRDEISTVAADVVDLKFAVARLEGPQPVLLRVR